MRKSHLKHKSAESTDETKSKSAAVEYLNIGLMLVALLLASIVPLELFLFSYAVLGPLHYLTEISWLHDRRYFALRPADWLPLVICAVLITLGNSQVIGAGGTDLLNQVQLAGHGLADVLHSVFWDITFVAFAAALVFVLTDRAPLRLFALTIVVIVALLFRFGASVGAMGFCYKLFGVYLPSLIHVFVFTGAFILLGALKRRSLAGYASLFVFVACGLLSVWLPNFAAASRTTAAEVFWRGFQELSLLGLQDILGYRIENLDGLNLYTSDLTLRLIRFFAFAYTYHYLNWFSKTSIIQWHAVSRVRLAIVAILWVASVALYYINYDLGLRWLFLLSLSHVLLEFPLNHKSFMEIASELKQRIIGSSTTG